MKNGVVKFATYKNIKVKRTKFPHRNIHNFASTSPDGQTHNQIDFILTVLRRYSSELDVRSFRTADCVTDQYLVVGKVRERLSVNKQRSHRFNIERFDLKKLNMVQSKEKYHIEVSNRFAALEYIDTEVEINSDGERFERI
jgi:hypothetical protein